MEGLREVGELEEEMKRLYPHNPHVGQTIREVVQELQDGSHLQQPEAEPPTEKRR